MPVSLSSAVQQGSTKSLPLRFAGNTKGGGAAYSNSAGGPTELCRPPGMLDLRKPNTEVCIREQTNLPVVGGKLQGSVRESLCSENKNAHTYKKRSSFLIKRN